MPKTAFAPRKRLVEKGWRPEESAESTQRFGKRPDQVILDDAKISTAQHQECTGAPGDDCRNGSRTTINEIQSRDSRNQMLARRAGRKGHGAIWDNGGEEGIRTLDTVSGILP